MMDFVIRCCFLHDDILTKISSLLQIVLALHPRSTKVGEDVVKDYMITPEFFHYLEDGEVRCSKKMLTILQISMLCHDCHSYLK